MGLGVWGILPLKLEFRNSGWLTDVAFSCRHVRDSVARITRSGRAPNCVHQNCQLVYVTVTPLQTR